MKIAATMPRRTEAVRGVGVESEEVDAVEAIRNAIEGVEASDRGREKTSS